MSSALVGVDVVDEGEDVLAVGGIVLEGQLDNDVVLGAFEEDGPGVEDVLVLVEILDELQDAALVLEIIGFAGTFVGDEDADAAVEEAQLAHALGQDLEAVFARFEDLVVGPERGLGPGLLGLAHLLKLGQRDAALVALDVDAAFRLDLQVQPLGQRVDDRDADAVQAARNFVGLVVELAAGVEHGHDDFGSRLLLRLVHAHRDAAAVVDHGDRVVDVDEDLDVFAEPGQGLVDGVVHDFVNEVVEAFRTGAADVHGGPLADRLQALEDLDALCRIFVFWHDHLSH